MKRLRPWLPSSLAALAAAAVVIVAWLVANGGFAIKSSGLPKDGGRANARERETPAHGQRGQEPGPQPRNDAGSNEGATETEPPDNQPERKFPENSGEPDWDPAQFANNLILWRMPAKSANTTELIADLETKFEGRPTFLLRVNAVDLRGDDSSFNPGEPDGMLAIHIGCHDWANAKAWLPEGTVEAISHDGQFVYRMATRDEGFEQFAIPYSYRQTEIIGLKVTGPGILPMEGLISQMGMAGRERRNVLTKGRVTRSDFRLFPANYTDFRTVTVRDADGQPLADAMLVHGAQIYGRSDQHGNLNFPWPRSWQSAGNAKTWITEEYFFLSVPGYVPLLLERSELESATTPVQVVVRAHELLVSAYEKVPDPDALKLGANAGRKSSVLEAGFDLVALPDEWPEITDWQAVRGVLGGGDATFLELDWPERWAFKPGHAIGDAGATKLAQVLGRAPTEHWSEYARWYYARWEYDEFEGRFDVVLPFPGQFLLLVGEYNYAPGGDEYDDYNGKLTHVLYLDARNPAEVKSKLLVHPLG